MIIIEHTLESIDAYLKNHKIMAITNQLRRLGYSGTNKGVSNS